MIGKKYIWILLLAVSFIFTPYIAPNAFAASKDKDTEKISFNFVDIDLPVVAKFVSEITGKNFIFDDNFVGKITIIAPSKISVNDAFSLFTSVLALKGFTVIPTITGVYKIIPTSDAKHGGMEVSGERIPTNESYVARLITLKNASSTEALNFILPMVSKDGFASVFGPGNMLLIIDSGVNVRKIASIIESIDQPSMEEIPEIVYLKYASAETVAKTINDNVSRWQRGALAQALPGGAGKAVADQRLNAVLLFGDKSKKDLMRSFISLLDVHSPETQGMINVYFMENADAVELAKVLQDLVKAGQAKQQIPDVPVMSVFETAGGISITADKASNALVVVASPADYQNLQRIIKQLDKRRKQVFVEAMIAEVSIDKLLELGSKWRAAVTRNGEPIFVGGVGTVDATTVDSILSGMTGLTLGGMSNYFTVPQTFVPGGTSDVKIPGISALFSMSDFKDAVNVLSTPQILTSDNMEAEILVGENIPLILNRERDVTTTSTVLTSIERKDVGILLKITPQINEGEYVKLDIYQEISAQKAGSENVITSIGPTMTKRSTKTSVVVKDKQTVVIGGLIEERDEESITKIPLLGDIPVLGWLFKYRSTSRAKKNLLVFLTPYIIDDFSDLSMITHNKLNDYVHKEKQYVEDELIVAFKEGVTAEAIRKILSGQKISEFKIIQSGVYHLKLDKSINYKKAINIFSSIPEVQKVEPVPRIRMSGER
ncbi:MAG: type II secretion system secretin GspD [Proteobacteria bacterium]|nr:type II secretion system secretin GspD [Pseudomonadota bacterium]MBU4010514.1 type II secretion system secretin GspD [Pseudomonadota bacterium]